MGAIQSSPIPECANNHPLVISETVEADYVGGFICNVCDSNSSSHAFDGLQHRRWHCTECAYDLCFTCCSEFFISTADLAIVDTKAANLGQNLTELVDVIREDDKAREILMRRYQLVPTLLHILTTGTSETDLDLCLEAVWYFTRNSYAVSRIHRSPLLAFLVRSLALETTSVTNLKKICRALYNIAMSTPQSAETSGIEALSHVSDFIRNLAVPLAKDDTELLTVCLDILDCLSNSTNYFKADLVYPDTPVLHALPALLAHGEGISVRTAYFMWVMVAVDNNKMAFCTCEGILPALKRLIDEDFDGARGNAFGTIWNLAALGSNKVLICSAELGLLPVLVRLIHDSDEATKISALGVTSNLSVEVQNKPLLLDPALNILPVLVRQVRENESTPRVTACQTLMNLAASEQGSADIMRTGVHVDLLGIIGNAPNDPSEWGGGSNEKVYSNTCLMNLAEWEANRAVLKRDGAVQVLGPLLTFNHFHSLTASMATAFLVGRDERGPHTELLKSGVIVIERLIDLLENTIAKSGGDGYQYGLFRIEVVVHACLELSVSDANKVKLAVPRVRDLLIDVIRNASPGGDGVDLYNSEDEVLKAANVAVETLLQISFIHDDSSELLADSGLFPQSCGLFPVLSNFATHTNADTNGTPIGLLLSRLSQRSLSSSLPPDPPTSASHAKHIMISYCWHKRAKPELVAALAKVLRQRGYEVWRDVDGSQYVAPMSSASEDDVMTRAVEASAAVVVCVSREYKQSPHCRIEATYANQRSKNGKLKMVYVMMQEEYTTQSEPEAVDGYMSSMIGDSQWCALFNDEDVSGAADFVTSIVGHTAKRIDGYHKPQKAHAEVDGGHSNSDAKVAVLEAKVVALEAKVESLMQIINRELGMVKCRITGLESTKDV